MLLINRNEKVFNEAKWKTECSMYLKCSTAERERTAQKRIMSAPNVSRERENSTENRGAG